ncbi:hypothetical protein B4102_3628 [Heyndrickxia sporothermodurans]|uniref:Uncharacterized protein n=1 Tax=Heyndrickxia sporothermodurans TaxID=46224 RepID=A0A150KL86_9BACI|nr:hypothetical protein [Heyndrickxia sporothermodurans]KYC94277.1 hypothetical protein B4102_3628 [Heyndrickxia sporothermodurans]
MDQKKDRKRRGLAPKKKVIEKMGVKEKVIHRLPSVLNKGRRIFF